MTFAIISTSYTTTGSTFYDVSPNFCAFSTQINVGPRMPQPRNRKERRAYARGFTPAQMLTWNVLVRSHKHEDEANAEFWDLILRPDIVNETCFGGPSPQRRRRRRRRA